jgi:anti-sigma factor (TIGR02949 family)
MASPAPDRFADCAEVVRSLWEYLDGRMSVEAADEIDVHLARCEGCRSHFEFEARMVQSLVALRRRHTDPERLRRNVLQVLREAGWGGEAVGPPDSGEAPPK